MKVKCLVSLLTVLTLLFPIKGQCDLVLTDVNIEAGTFTIEFLNTTNCGGTGGPDGVSEIQIGFQALDPDNNCSAMNQGWTFPFGLTTSDDSNHPGWVYSATSAELPISNWTNGWDDWPWDIDPPYYAGETITFPLYNQYQSDCVNGPFANGLFCQLEDVLNYWLDEGLSIQAVIWQISYGPTMYADNGGWAEVGGLGGGITPPCCGLYEDQNFEDNWLIIGPCADPNPGPDAVIGNVEFNVGCIGDTPAYSIDYTIYNYGDEEITDYCIEIWNEDYFQCFNSDLFDGGFGNYAIPPGEGQAFSTPFFEFDGNPGGFFTMTVDSVNGTDEIVTGNNNTTVFYPEFPTCPLPPDTLYIELPPDTLTFFDIDTIYITNTEYVIDTVEIETITYVYQIDSVFVTDTVTDTLYVELPPDTLTLIEIDTLYQYIIDTLYVELPPDTVTLTQIDTVYIPWEWYFYDTVYVDNFIYDTTYIEIQLPPDTVTIIETELVYDTLYIDNYIYEYDTLYLTEYIVLTDTITEYIIQEILIDCNTGLPCGEEPPGFECPDWTTIHIPNTFTPNNDGINDVWQIKYDLDCWEDIEFWIYNRWGDQIYHSYGDSFDSYPFWDGSVDDGNHYVSDGTYIYIVQGKKLNRSEIIKEQGHITIFR